MPQLSIRVTYLVLIGLLFFASVAGSQQIGQPAATASGQEFPVTFQQTVTSGKTPVGTKVQAKLVVATLVNGVVIPRNAVFSGEVVESVAKTKTNPSRLAIRMDSAQWKNGTTEIKAFLTRWYYPGTDESGQNLQYGPTQSPKKGWDGKGQYPDPNSPAYKPFPGDDSDKKQSVPDTPATTTSNHRVVMKDVESAPGDNGSIALVDKRSNIKLDKFTTYVLAVGDLPSVK